MTSDTTKCGCPQPAEQASAGLFDNWFDPIESALRDRVRGFIEELIRDELEGVLARPRYGRQAKEADGVTGTAGYRHGGRRRTPTGTFGRSEITVPRARLHTGDGGTAEWKSTVLRANPKLVSHEVPADGTLQFSARRPGQPGQSRLLVPADLSSVGHLRMEVCVLPERPQGAIGRVQIQAVPRQPRNTV